MGCPAREERSLLAYQQLAACGGDVLRKLCAVDALQLRDAGKGVLLISLELDEVMQLSDRILVIYEGQIVADLDPKAITVQELGLYMAGSKRGAGK